jgi:polyisoprenoid-binding protein YceI
MTWQLDTAHSGATVAVKHMMISTVRGHFSGITGELELDRNAPERSSVRVSIPAETVDTGDAKRDAHLKSPDFFDAANHPFITFRSTAVQAIGGERYRVTGDLAIRGVTKPATVEVELLGIVPDPRAGERAGFSARATIDRRDWGLTWNMPIPSGVLVGESVAVEFDLAAVPQTVAAAA